MKAKELLADRSKWIKKQWAEDKHGNYVNPRYSTASCWCMYGAIMKCYPTLDGLGTAIRKVEELIEAKMGYDNITEFNDDLETSHEMVLSILQEADV